jgi:hypothetical protein
MQISKNCVAIAPYLPPSTLPRAIQLARMLPILGLDMLVITSIPNAKIKDVEILVIKKKTWSLLIGKVIAKIFPFFLRNFDLDFFWSISVSLKILASKKKISIVLTFSQPISVHLVGFFLKKFKISKVWIAHISDPITNNPHATSNFLNRFLNKQWESVVIKNADKIIVTNSRFRDLLLQDYPELNPEKVLALLPIADFKLKSPLKIGNRLKFTHTGSLYNGRSVEWFCKALENISHSSSEVLDDIDFTFIGELSSTNEELLLNTGKSVHLKVLNARVSQELSESACLSADVLITIEAPIDRNPFFPSKIADYISLPRHQLLLSKDGAAKDLLRNDCGFSFADPSSTLEIEESILTIHRLWKERNLQTPSLQSQNLFSATYASAKLELFLEDLNLQ